MSRTSKPRRQNTSRAASDPGIGQVFMAIIAAVASLHLLPEVLHAQNPHPEQRIEPL